MVGSPAGKGDYGGIELDLEPLAKDPCKAGDAFLHLKCMFHGLRDDYP